MKQNVVFMMRDRRRIALLGAAALTVVMLTLLLWFPGRSEAGPPMRTLDVTPSSAVAGATVTVSGTGGWLSSNPPFVIFLQDGIGGSILGNFSPGGEGSWSENVMIPEDATPGGYQIIACEGCGGDFELRLSRDFTVLPPPVPRTLDLDPTSGLPGTSVTVTGDGDWLAVNPPFEIFWDAKGGESLGDFTPGGDGSWNEDVAIPGDATPGPHEIVACEGYGGDFQLCVSESFSVLAPDRTLDLDPDSGLPGSVVTVTGDGGWLYDVNPPYLIFWDTKGGDELDNFVVGVDGSWDETVAVPNDATPGAHQIVACEGVGGDFQTCVSAAFTVLSPSTSTPEPTDTPEPGSLSGDADCNGVVNAIDAAYILQYAAGLIGSVPCPDNADVNSDGNISAIDAALVLQYAAGLLPALPP